MLFLRCLFFVYKSDIQIFSHTYTHLFSYKKSNVIYNDYFFLSIIIDKTLYEQNICHLDFYIFILPYRLTKFFIIHLT